MFGTMELARRLAELNEAWHATAEAGKGNDIDKMERTVERLDAAEAWFKDRNIKLVYDGKSGNHALAPEKDQPTWHQPRS